MNSQNSALCSMTQNVVTAWLGCRLPLIIHILRAVRVSGDKTQAAEMLIYSIYNRASQWNSQICPRERWNSQTSPTVFNTYFIVCKIGTLRLNRLPLGIHNIVNAPEWEEKVGAELRGGMESTGDSVPLGICTMKWYGQIPLSRLRAQLFPLQSYLLVWNFFLLPKVTNKHKTAILMKKTNSLSSLLSHAEILLGQE